MSPLIRSRRSRSRLLVTSRKSFVFVGRLLVTFAASRRLSTGKKVIRFVRFDVKCFQKKAVTFVDVVLIKFEQPDAGPCEMFFSVQPDRIDKKIASLAKTPAGEQHRPQNRKRPRIVRLALGHGKTNVGSLDKASAFDENVGKLDLCVAAIWIEFDGVPQERFGLGQRAVAGKLYSLFNKGADFVGVGVLDVIGETQAKCRTRKMTRTKAEAQF